MKCWLIFLLAISFQTYGAGTLGNTGGSADCDGTCNDSSQGQTGVQMASLVVGVPPFDSRINDTFCGYANDDNFSYRNFLSYLENRNIPIDYALRVRCRLRRGEPRSINFFAKAAYERNAVQDFSNPVVRYLLNNQKEHVFIGLVRGLDGGPNLIDEMINAWRINQRFEKKAQGICEMGLYICNKIKRRSTGEVKILELMTIYNNRCTNEPFSTRCRE